MPNSELDPRIVTVGLEIGGRLKTYTGLHVVASGTVFANALMGDGEVRISNLSKEDRDYILTESRPYFFPRARKRVFVWAGRQSYGVRLLFQGDIVSATVSQPPDIVLTLRARSMQYYKGDLVSVSAPSVIPLSRLSAQVAQGMGLSLDFRATDKQISNYQFSGANIKQVGSLADAGRVDAYVDGETLVVKNRNTALPGVTTTLSQDSGMIGIPELTVQGIKVKYLLDRVSRLGSGLRVESKLNPAANGEYVIYKLTFEVASRDTPFYYIAEARRPGMLLP